MKLDANHKITFQTVVLEDLHVQENDGDRNEIIGYWNKYFLIANSSTLSYIELDDEDQNMEKEESFKSSEMPEIRLKSSEMKQITMKKGWKIKGI